MKGVTSSTSSAFFPKMAKKISMTLRIDQSATRPDEILMCRFLPYIYSLNDFPAKTPVTAYATMPMTKNIMLNTAPILMLFFFIIIKTN